MKRELWNARKRNNKPLLLLLEGNRNGNRNRNKNKNPTMSGPKQQVPPAAESRRSSACFEGCLLLAGRRHCPTVDHFGSRLAVKRAAFGCKISLSLSLSLSVYLFALCCVCVPREHKGQEEPHSVSLGPDGVQNREREESRRKRI